MHQLSAGLMLTLAIFSSAGPLSIDMYLPGLPQLQQELGTTPGAVQLTISAFMIGMAVGNLLFGAISDGTGRKRPLVIASVIFFLTSVGCALAPTIGTLIAVRFLQGLAGGCVIVVSRAVVPDLVHGVAAARAFSALQALSGFMPALAPAIGGLLIPTVGWRGVFWVLAGVNLLQLVVALRMPETLPAEKRSPGALSGLASRIWRCLQHPVFVGYMLAGSLGFGALFAYISGSPLVLQVQLGQSPTAYAFTFGAIALLFPISNALNMRVVRSVAPRKVLVWALLIDACVTTILIILSLIGPALVPVVLCLALLAVMSGFISANASALAVEEIRAIGAGAGSGAMGFAQFLIAGVVPALVGLGSNHALTMSVVSLVCAGAAFAGMQVLTRAK
ncbi:multidrug effflux MFS transporter [Corynebacterium riegelii]|uniref:multidrug effflux MFS transporter n=1 Tax=Corynebacterium riegelii TaxID=156976 RepID=UPI0023F9AC60|nr:multidrug effflux MFS transporter [Corynebacterium riegelii]